MTPEKVRLRLIICAIAATSFSVAPAAKGNIIPIVDIDPARDVSSIQWAGKFWGSNEGHNNCTIGWTFTVRDPLTITHVGWYDAGQDGLSRAFQVGLWQDSSPGSQYGVFVQQLLGDPGTGITIPAGSGAALCGVWREADLPVPLELQQGCRYALAGLDTATTTDTIVCANISGYENDLGPPGVLLSVGAACWGFGGQNAIHAPDVFLLDNGVEMGPMLFIGVPEPATLLLFAIGTTSLLGFRGPKPF